MKAQSALEFMTVFAVLLISLIFIFIATWNNMTRIEKSSIDVKSENLLVKTANAINTVFLEGDGFETNITLPDTINGFNYTFFIENDILWLTVGNITYNRRLITENVTGTLKHGVNKLKNQNGFVVIS